MSIQLVFPAMTAMCAVYQIAGLIAGKRVHRLPAQARSVVMATLRRYHALWALWWLATLSVEVARAELTRLPPANVPAGVREALWMYTVDVTLLLYVAFWSGASIVLGTIRYTDKHWRKILREEEFYKSHKLLIALLCALPAALYWGAVLLRLSQDNPS